MTGSSRSFPEHVEGTRLGCPVRPQTQLMLHFACSLGTCRGFSPPRQAASCREQSGAAHTSNHGAQHLAAFSASPIQTFLISNSRPAAELCTCSRKRETCPARTAPSATWRQLGLAAPPRTETLGRTAVNFSPNALQHAPLYSCVLSRWHLIDGLGSDGT